MSLAAAKSELLEVMALEPRRGNVDKLSLIVSVAQRELVGDQHPPGSKQEVFARALKLARLTRRIPGLLLPDAANLFATGYQSLVFIDGSTAVKKFPIDTIGASDTAIYAYTQYEEYCLATMKTIFGDELLPDTQVGSGYIRIRPYGELGSAVITQDRVGIGHDLFSDTGLWLASDAEPGSKLHSGLVKLLDGAKVLKDEHGVYLDTVGKNNIVITESGELILIDYDPNQHDGELVHDWERENLQLKKYAIDCLRSAVRH